MTSNPIHKVLSILKMHKVKHLLMGGQACVFYGAAEFSRDTDVALLASSGNLKKLAGAVSELDAKVIAVPPFRMEYLKKGHAVHFRCGHPDAYGMRLDVMSIMRGLPDFEVLWKRRTIVHTRDDEGFDLLALPDLVTAKKTQRDKDWPMIRRLVESHYVQYCEEADREKAKFWLAELRTPGLLKEIALQFPDVVEQVSAQRPFLTWIKSQPDEIIEQALRDEEEKERLVDRAYWAPLRKELEFLRREAVSR